MPHTENPLHHVYLNMGAGFPSSQFPSYRILNSLADLERLFKREAPICVNQFIKNDQFKSEKQQLQFTFEQVI